MKIDPVALTTVDNPFSPFSQFDQWFAWDIGKGYNSCGYLARVAHCSSQLSDEENNAEMERAIDEIVAIDPLNIYKKVKLSEEKERQNKSENM